MTKTSSVLSTISSLYHSLTKSEKKNCGYDFTFAGFGGAKPAF